MATTVARLQAVLGADTHQFDRAMDRSHSKISVFAKSAAVAAGAAGVGALFYTLKTGINEWKQQQIVMAQTNAVLKSTRHGAHITAKSIGEMATALMKKSGVDDEAIQSSENLLLTFRDIRNETGKNNDIFNQATKAALDLSVAFHKDLNSSSILVGKALQDPVKGMTALRRVGVTLTAAQQDQVKAFVKSGETMKAQKIILSELTKETGGSAEAYGKTLPGMIDIAKESFRNWAGELITKMIPALTRMTNWVREHWPEISKAITEAWASIKPTLDAFRILVVSVVQTIRNHWGTIGPIVTQATRVIRDQLAIVAGIIKFFAAILRGDWSEAWHQLKRTVVAVFTEIKDYLKLEIQVFWTIAKAIGTGVWHGFKAGAEQLWDAVKGLFHGIVGWIKHFLGIESPSKVFYGIGQNMIKGVINGVGDMAGGLKKKVIDIVKSLPAAAAASGGLFGHFGFGGGKAPPGEHSKGSAEHYLVPWAHKEGMTVTSVAGGSHVKGSYHYQHRAIDVAGSAGAMHKFFLDSLAHFGLGNITELFYDPMGEYVKNGSLRRGSIGGHSDHVHIALGEGGIVTRAMNALIGERGREAVIPLDSAQGKAALGGDITIPIYLGGEQIATVVFDMLRRRARTYEKRNLRGAFGNI